MLSNTGLCICFNCHLLFICLWYWWIIKKGGIYRFFWNLLVHSFSALWDLRSPQPPTCSLSLSWLWQVAHKQPWLLSSGVKLATPRQCSNIPGGEPMLSGVYCSLSLPPSMQTWVCKSILPQFLCLLLQFPYGMQAHLELHWSWLEPWHSSWSLKIFSTRVLASIYCTSNHRLRSYKLVDYEDWQEYFCPDFEFHLPPGKKFTKVWYYKPCTSIYMFSVFVSQ